MLVINNDLRMDIWFNIHDNLSCKLSESFKFHARKYIFSKFFLNVCLNDTDQTIRYYCIFASKIYVLKYWNGLENLKMYSDVFWYPIK